MENKQKEVEQVKENFTGLDSAAWNKIHSEIKTLKTTAELGIALSDIKTLCQTVCNAYYASFKGNETDALYKALSKGLIIIDSAANIMQNK